MPDRMPLRVKSWCGVYVLYQMNQPVYVGRSKSIGCRLLRHRRRFGFDYFKVSFLPCNGVGNHESKLLERKLLNRIRPRHNRVIPSDVGATFGLGSCW